MSILDARPEAILFDLDGTLADTALDLGRVANMLRFEEGLEPLAMQVLRPHTSSGVRGMLHAAFGLMPGDAPYAALSERFLSHYEHHLCVETRLFDQMPEVLDALDNQDIKWGIVTNKRSRYTHPLIAALGLAKRAACVISGDSTPHPKPAPGSLLHACALAGVRPEQCIYVGDDLRDIQAGRAACMKTVAAAYGYLGLDTPIERWNADAIIQSPDELLKLLRLI